MTKPNPAPSASPPLAALFDLVGRRWTLRILWELQGRTLSFNDLRRAVGGMSQSVLVTRLTELFGGGLVADVPGGYRLTAQGAALVELLAPAEAWAKEWSTREPE
jgi:DNA-binding HxlR family transcriptional regulator